MATTATAIRDLMITTVLGKTPVSLASHKYVQHDNQADFREWCAQNPAAAFRKFAIRDQFAFQEPRISNTTEEEVWTTFEVVVAYPTAGKGLYGAKQRLSMETVMEQDLHQLRHAIGSNGYATLDTVAGGAATVVEDGPSVEMGDPVSFVTLNLRVRYLRSMS